jgi:hypothetical protein
MTETGSWQRRPLTAFFATEAEVQARFGPPTFPGEDSNGLGEMDVWEVSFDCGLRAVLLLMREHGRGEEPVAIGSPGERGVEVYASDTERSHLAHHLGGRDWSPFLPDRTHDDPCMWVVRRVDDNGNVFEVERFSHRCGADALATQLTARGHKQTYWVERIA